MTSGDHVSCVSGQAPGQASLVSVVIITLHSTLNSLYSIRAVMTIISITRLGTTIVTEFPKYFREYRIGIATVEL